MNSVPKYLKFHYLILFNFAIFMFMLEFVFLSDIYVIAFLVNNNFIYKTPE